MIRGTNDTRALLHGHWNIMEGGDIIHATFHWNADDTRARKHVFKRTGPRIWKMEAHRNAKKIVMNLVCVVTQEIARLPTLKMLTIKIARLSTIREDEESSERSGWTFL